MRYSGYQRPGIPEATGRSAVAAGLSRRRKVGAFGLLVLALVVAVATVAYVVFGGEGGVGVPGQPKPTIRRIAISTAGLGCVFGAQVSPDGKTIAALAGAAECGSAPTSQAENLALFDAATGKVERKIKLTAAVSANAHAPSGESIQGVSFSDWLWSADSQRLAFLANVSTLGASGGGGTAAVAVVQARTGSVRIVVSPFASYSSQNGGPGATGGQGAVSSYTPGWATRVDLRAGAIRPLALTQALGYTWQPDGSLAVQTALPASAKDAPSSPRSGPLGTAYGASFSLWQQATVAYTHPYCSAPYYLLSLGADAWSPDGNFIVFDGAAAGGATEARLAFSPPTVAVPTRPGGGGYICDAQGRAQDLLSAALLAPVAPRDAGMQSALGVFGPVQSQGGIINANGMSLTWAPDGRRVAAVTFGVAGGLAPQLAIYDCQSGRLVTSYTAQALDPAYDPYSENSQLSTLSAASWSGDGKTVLVYDGKTLVLLGSGALGS